MPSKQRRTPGQIDRQQQSLLMRRYGQQDNVGQAQLLPERNAPTSSAFGPNAQRTNPTASTRNSSNLQPQTGQSAGQNQPAGSPSTHQASSANRSTNDLSQAGPSTVRGPNGQPMKASRPEGSTSQHQRATGQALRVATGINNTPGADPLDLKTAAKSLPEIVHVLETLVLGIGSSLASPDFAELLAAMEAYRKEAYKCVRERAEGRYTESLLTSETQRLVNNILRLLYSLYRRFERYCVQKPLHQGLTEGEKSNLERLCSHLRRVATHRDMFRLTAIAMFGDVEKTLIDGMLHSERDLLEGIRVTARKAMLAYLWADKGYFA